MAGNRNMLTNLHEYPSLDNLGGWKHFFKVKQNPFTSIDPILKYKEETSYIYKDIQYVLARGGGRK